MKRGRSSSSEREEEAKKRTKTEVKDKIDPELRKVFVSNIDNKISIADVRSFLLDQVGDKAEDFFVMPRKIGAPPGIQHRGIAWIILNRPEDTDWCISTVHGQRLGTRELNAKRHTGSSDQKKRSSCGI